MKLRRSLLLAGLVIFGSLTCVYAGEKTGLPAQDVPLLQEAQPTDADPLRPQSQPQEAQPTDADPLRPQSQPQEAQPTDADPLQPQSQPQKTQPVNPNPGPLRPQSQPQKMQPVNPDPDPLHRQWLEGSVMDGALVFSRPLEKGMNGDDVNNLQQRLFDLGYVDVSPDGIFDEKTEAGLKAFQEDHGLQADGIVGPKTQEALNWRHFLDEPVTSALADSVILTEKCYSREGNPIRFIIPHHMAARNTGAGCAQYFTHNTAGTSANYCVGYDGDIAQNVPEQYGAWTSGDVRFDRQAITIEVSDLYNDDYRIPEAAQDAFVDLCVDIVKRNPSLGGRLVYDPEDEARVIAIKQNKGSWDSIRGNVLIHCWTTTVGTTCPEWHMKEILPELIDRVNSKLQAENE